jgi:ketosteroid isomerase-like protein
VSNADTVRTIYASFGRGDIEGILDRLHPEVGWERWADGNSLQDAGYPPMQQRNGRDGVLAFLGAVQETIDLPVFEDADTVVSRLRVRVHFRESGREIDDDEWHVWTFDDEGRVLTLRHLIDTKKHHDAWLGR